MDYEIENQPMTCGQSEAASRKYKKIQGKSRYWYVAIQENEADNIYVTPDVRETKPGYKGFQGFGGATIPFELEDGTIDQVMGPWHSNSTALFLDTGYDIRDKHLTFGVIARDCGQNPKNPYGQGIMIDVIWMDEKPTVGKFERVSEIAQDIANKEGKPVICYSRSTGGSSRGPVKPLWMENI